MNDSLLEKKRGNSFVYHPVRNVCGKFEVNRLNRFGAEAREVFTSQKTFLSEIPLNMKTITSNSISI